DHGVPLVVLRPGFVYGPGDRTVLPRLIKRLRQGRVHYLRGGKRALKSIYVGHFVEGRFLAVDQPPDIRQVFQLTDSGRGTKGRSIRAVAEGMGLKRPRQALPRWLAAVLARVWRRLIIRAGPNGQFRLTFAQFKFMQLNLDFCIEKAKRELGYQPRVGFDQAM